MKIEYTEEKNKSIMETLLTTALDVEEMMAVGYALAKRLPKEPEKHQQDYNDHKVTWHTCVGCGKEVLLESKYCTECGQRIR